MSAASTTKILPSLSGKLGILELNNAKIYHSLDLEMVVALREIMTAWHSSSIKGILMRSSAAKRPAFCAGGDVKRVYGHGIKPEEGPHGKGAPGVYTAEMFRQEFIVCNMIETWDRPQISFWDGIVMGGGVGISIYGKYRVATENTVFAMPETGIGLFPDVGSMYWMTQMLDWSVASYLALTGARINAPDLLHTGLATHYVPSDRLDELQKSLVSASEEAPPGDGDVFAPILMSFHQEPPSVDAGGSLSTHADSIHKVFGEEAITMEEIMLRLEARTDEEFSKETLQMLQKMSPTSLKVTLEGLKRGKAMPSLEEDLRMEFRMSQGFMREGTDFYRGIRAVLVDKDHNPQWNPSTLEEVTEAMVESYFEPLAENDWVLPSKSNL